MDLIWIFANPIAGRGQGLAIAQRLQHRLEQGGFASRLILERADTLPDEALADSPRAALVIGGDGTLRTVAQRLYHPGLPHAPPLLPIPLGTANLMGRHLQIRWKARQAPNQVLSALSQMRIQRLDAALANEQLCLLMAHVGFDAQVVHELARARRGPIRYASYVRPTFTALAKYAAPVLSVHLDDRPIFEGQGMAFVGNIAEYGVGFPLLPYARADDGLLDVCCVPGRTRPDVIKLFLNAAAGRHALADRTIYLQGRHIRIDAHPSAAVQIDGDPAGFTPLEVRLLPNRIPFIVP